MTPNALPCLVNPRAQAKRRNRVIHSCLECRRRKMKCDRGEPCNNCKSSGRHCDYVKSATTDAELRQRITETKEAKDALDAALLKTQTGEKLHKRTRKESHGSSDDEDTDEDFGDDAYLEPTPLAVADAAYGDHENDEMDDLGVMIGRMCLRERIGGLYRPRIADELSSSLQHSQSRSSPSTSADTVSPEPQLDPSPALLFGASTHVNLTQYIPSRQLCDQLLKQYWSAVHPVVRVLHRPSFAQRYELLWEAFENSVQPPPSLVAIVCAVLFSAVVSMPEADTVRIASRPRLELLSQLKVGTEAALSKAHLLRTTKLETLQAFVAYLLSLCIGQISRALTVLAGTLVRLAECMGLHRDPTEFGFSSTECHIRRLIWYQVCYIDLKTSKVHGPRPFVHPDGYTTQLPLDVTLHSQNNWNDTIFSMIRFECQEMHRRCQIYRDRVNKRKMTLTKAIAKVEEFRIAMDVKYAQYIHCASPSPMQKMAALVLKLHVSLLYLIDLHRYMNSITYRLPNRLRQIVLVKGTEALEAAVELESDDQLQQWAWYSPAYHQYHTAFLLLVEVFAFPRRREASRIWRCLDFIFEEPLATISPLTGTSPSIEEVIQHRYAKARFLLALISDRMRAYHTAKQTKVPAHFKESMIGVMPKKAGDSLDPRVPLNHAHGDPTARDTRRPGKDGEHHFQPTTKPGYRSSNLAVRDISAAHSALPEYLNSTAYPWSSSSEHSSSWIQTTYIDPDAIAGSQPSKERQGCHNTSTNDLLSEFLSTSQHLAAPHVDSEEVDLQELEIDWDLWDTMFPLSSNDGTLNISDEHGVLGSTPAADFT